MQIPEQYKGREQSYLKHRVLEEYLLAWGHKLGSLAQRRRVRLCYVDGFAGPWQAKDADLADTSIAIGLGALEAAASTWRDKGFPIDVDAFFVEKDPRSFKDLQRFLQGRAAERTKLVRAEAYPGEFGSQIDTLLRRIGSDPAFIFVDPTGWKGAAMGFIAPLLAGSQQRDVLVNVMFDHINRFKDDPRQFLRDQMREFFGLEDRDMPEALTEDQLFELYRSQLKAKCRVQHAADLAIPHPVVERTKFRLVVGGKNPAVLEVFRDVEKKVMGREAAEIREAAALRANEERTGQMSLLATPRTTDTRYESLHTRALDQAPRDVLALLTRRQKPVRFEELWPELLEAHHITKRELGQMIWGMSERGEIRIDNMRHRERSVKDEHILRVAKISSG